MGVQSCSPFQIMETKNAGDFVCKTEAGESEKNSSAVWKK
jgi:hypothetical protein